MAGNTGFAPGLARRSTRFRRARRRAFFAIVRSLGASVRFLPRFASVALLRGLAEIAWRTRPYDRDVALRQLERALPASTSAERQRIARRSLNHLGETLVDSLRADRPVVMDDAEALNDLVADGRPVLFLTAHLGCWEALGRFLPERLGEFGAVTANPHNDSIHRWLTAERERFGTRTFDRERDGLAAARWLRSGRALAVLADLRTSVASVPAPWFGALAPTIVSPGRMARRFGARLVPIGVRSVDGTHRIELGEEIAWTDQDDDLSLATRCNAALEAMILRAPEQWIWFHDRYGESTGRA